MAIGVKKSDIHKVITTMIAICLRGWLKKERFLPDGLKNVAIGKRISTTTIKKQKEIMEAVASINSSSRVYPIEELLSHPEAYSGAVFVLEESYIIGANRNYYLNRLSIILFGMVIILLSIHASLRLIIKH